MWGSVNVPGGTTQGADGKSAYEVAVANGFSGTEAQWLASLKGETGATGGIGAAGATGPAGPGLPPGGTAGQVPVKVDGTDYNTQWKALTADDVSAMSKSNPICTGYLHIDNIANSGNFGAGGTELGYGNISNSYSMAIGRLNLAIDTYGAVDITSCSMSQNGWYEYTISIGGSNASRIWSKLESAAGSTVWACLVYYDNSKNSYGKIFTNTSVKTFNKDANTIVVTSNKEKTDVEFKYLIISDTCGFIGTDAVAIGTDNIVIRCGRSAYGADSHTIGVQNVVLTEAIYSIGVRLLATKGGSYSYPKVVLGRYNADTLSSNDALIVGGGSSNARANVFRATTTGTYANGSYNATGADYAELFEWLDGNPRNEDRIGLFVTLDGEKVRLAKPGDDFILGVVSGNPSVVGDAYDDQWQGMYATDIFGRFIYEDAVIPAEYDEDGNLISEEHTETRLKINPAYNANEPYVPRSQRREWVTVGMMGKLTVIDDGTCQVNGWCTVGAGGVATASESRTKYRVMSRLDGNHVRVLIL